VTVLSLDVESRSGADLKKTGAARYFEDFHADVLCAAFALGDGPVQTWRRNEPPPQVWQDHVLGGGLVSAHNAFFEYLALKHVLGPKYGWAVPKISQMRDTMAQCAAMSIPQSLDGAAQALALPVQKDKDGQRLIRKFCISRKARAGEKPWGTYFNAPEAHAEDFAKLVAYCAQDVEVERALRNLLVPLSEAEQAVWELTIQMNDRGVLLDLPLVKAMLKITDEAKERLDAALARATNWEVLACSQVSQLTAWLQRNGVPADKLNKNAIEDLLSSDLPEAARRAVEIRKEAAKTSTAKIKTMLDWACHDGRVRGLHAYHGASTGRWCLPWYTPVTVLRDGAVADVPIVEVSTSDLVWDGDEWVAHEGVVFSGYKEVMSYRGVVATPEHKVYVGQDIQMPLGEAAALQKDLWRGQPPLPYLLRDVAEREAVHRFDEHGRPKALERACSARGDNSEPTPATGLDTKAWRGGVYADGAFGGAGEDFRAGSGVYVDRASNPGAERLSRRRSGRGDGGRSVLDEFGFGPGKTEGVLGDPLAGLQGTESTQPRPDRGAGGEGPRMAGQKPAASVGAKLSRDSMRPESAGPHNERPPLWQGRSAEDTFREAGGAEKIAAFQPNAEGAVGVFGPVAAPEEHKRSASIEVGSDGFSRAGEAPRPTCRSAGKHTTHRGSEGAAPRGHSTLLGRGPCKEATFDLVNAGPRNRFRAWGTIVSNSGRGPQFQNLARGTGTVKDPEAAKADFVKGSADWIQITHGSPMSGVSDMLRSCIISSPRHRFLAADYSSIEGRVTAWVAGEDWKLDAFRANDRGEGAGMYELAAAGIFNVDPFRVSKQQRQVGKASELALGFGGGVLAYFSMANIYGIDMAPVYPILRETTDAEILGRAAERYEECLGRGDTGTDVLTREAWIASEVTKVLWRNKHPATVALWKGLQDAARDAVQRPGEIVTYACISYLVRRGFLWCRLPSGRCLAYGAPKVQERETPWGTTSESVTALGVNSVTKKWERFALYGGLLTENVVQAIARDLMAHGMLKAERAGYPIVMTVHDEAVADVPEGQGSLEGFEACLCDLPDWAAGLPLVASGYEAKAYKKD